jgi:hypothetical protein
MRADKGEFERRRLMNLIRPDEAHGSIIGLLATTFDLEPDFVESDYLPTFLGVGGRDDISWASTIKIRRLLQQSDATVILMDGRRFRGRPRALHLEVLPTIGPAGSKLHAKVTLIVQEKAVRLMVGSANLTTRGYRSNREVALSLIATAKDRNLVPLIHQAIDGMRAPLEKWWTPGAERVATVAARTIAAWDDAPPSSDSFVWSYGRSSLAEAFGRAWPDEPVSSISIVSPFWSDEGAGGPVEQLLGRLGLDRVRGAKVRLFAEQAPDTTTTLRPLVPAGLASWDCRPLGIQADLVAVDPHVLPEEVGGRTDYQPVRALHAKLVVVEGPRTSLAYVGSANFTHHGWGFAASRSNIEAGVILRRSGADRGTVAALLPKTAGTPVPLDGKGLGRVSVVEKTDDNIQWPSFIRDIRLCESADDSKVLQLQINLDPDAAPVQFTISPIGADDTLLTQDRHATGALEPAMLERLMHDQVVEVRWGDECRAEVPINIDLVARSHLPIAPGTAAPGEQLLLAYYQGRISEEDIYPPPPGDPGDNGGGDDLPATASTVDTSTIQSYQIREFVEALQGIFDDLRRASGGTEAAMRQALLGELSPTALAQQVMHAVEAGTRSPVAAGFQLTEILVCLNNAKALAVDKFKQDAWQDGLRRAHGAVSALLATLLTTKAAEFPPSSDFHRYYRTALKAGTLS